MEKVIFTNSRSEKVEFSCQYPYVLQQISGTGGIEASLQMQKAPFQDGQTLIDTALEPRQISLNVAIMTVNEAETFEKRAKLLKVLNPKLGQGILRYEYGDKVKEILAAVDMSPVFAPGKENKGLDYQLTTFSFLCPNPFWLDINQEEWTMASFEGGFSFPMSFPLSFGTVGQTVEVDNVGDVETPVLIKFKGPLSNPVLDNVTTGKKITITKDILIGETLEINTEFGNKFVEIVLADGTRSNAFHYISPDSDLWNLELGKNTLSYASTASAGDSAAIVYYKNRYVGV